MRRRAATVLFGIFIFTYLGFLLYFLSLKPGGPSGNPAVVWAVTCFASGGMMMMAVI